MALSEGHLQECVLNALGPFPQRTGGGPIAYLRHAWQSLDYNVTAKLVRHLAGGSPRFVLYRCYACRKLISGKKLMTDSCSCGSRKYMPATGVRLPRALLLALSGG